MMASSVEDMPVLPHLAPELYLWLWWASEQDSGHFDIEGGVGRIELWVDSTLAFRVPGESGVTALHTGEHAAETPESKAAIDGGKVIERIRLRIKRDDRDYVVTLNGPASHITQASLPQGLQDSEADAILDRLFCYTELHFIIAGLWRAFGTLRLSKEWDAEVVPAIQAWVSAADGT